MIFEIVLLFGFNSSFNLRILAKIVTLLPSNKNLVVIFRSNSHSQMGNPIPFRRTYRTSYSASQKVTSGRKGGPRVQSHGVSWCESSLLFIAPRKRRKRILCIASYFLLFPLPFVFAASVLSLRYALRHRRYKIRVRKTDRFFEYLRNQICTRRDG